MNYLKPSFVLVASFFCCQVLAMDDAKHPLADQVALEDEFVAVVEISSELILLTAAVIDLEIDPTDDLLPGQGEDKIWIYNSVIKYRHYLRPLHELSREKLATMLAEAKKLVFTLDKQIVPNSEAIAAKILDAWQDWQSYDECHSFTGRVQKYCYNNIGSTSVEFAPMRTFPWSGSEDFKKLEIKVKDSPREINRLNVYDAKPGAQFYFISTHSSIEIGSDLLLSKMGIVGGFTIAPIKSLAYNYPDICIGPILSINEFGSIMNAWR